MATESRAQVMWQLATEYPQSTVSGEGLSAFARHVADRTGGFVTVEPRFESGISSGALIRAVTDKRVTGGDAFGGPLETIDPLFGLPSLPFVAQSVAAAQALNAGARPAYEAALAKRGLKLLYLTIWPPTGLWSDRALATAEDLRGLTVRTYDGNSERVMTEAGARAIDLPFAEVIAKLKSRELNAVLTSGDGGAGRKLWDTLTHFTAITYAVPISLAFVDADAFAALRDDRQRQVLEAALQTEQDQHARLGTRIEENYRRMREKGVAIMDPPPPALIAHLMARARPVIAAWKARAPADAARRVDGPVPAR